MEPEPHRAALRPHPPHRPDARSAACGTSSPTTPARARCSPGCWRRSRSSARPTAARCSTCSATAFSETPLRNLLIEAIRYGELPETRGQDGRGHRRQRRATGSRSCSPSARSPPSTLQHADIAAAARADGRGAGPAPAAALHRAAPSGRRSRGSAAGSAERERGRFEITHVPGAAAHQPARGPIATRYDRVTFDIEHVSSTARRRAPTCSRPGTRCTTPSSTRRSSARRRRSTAARCSSRRPCEEPRLLVGVIEEIVDATGDVGRAALRLRLRRRARRGRSRRARRRTSTASPRRRPTTVVAARGLPWLARGRGASRELDHRQPAARRSSARSSRAASAELQRVRDQVAQRLDQEMQPARRSRRWSPKSRSRPARSPSESHDEPDAQGGRPRRPPAARGSSCSTASCRCTPGRRASSPRARAAAGGWSRPSCPPTRRCTPSRPRRSSAAASTSSSPPSARSAAPRSSRPFNNPASTSSPQRDGEDPIRIEVKARIAGAEDFFVTHNEVLTALEQRAALPPRARAVDPRGAEHDEVRYLENPFAGFDAGDFDATGHRGNWDDDLGARAGSRSEPMTTDRSGRRRGEHRKRKLIEVALPLETINRESAREKSIRHGHPSTLHLWWARRPLAAARAVLFAQLVDDPSSHPDRFPTEEAQRAERERLHGIIERLVVWENIARRGAARRGARGDPQVDRRQPAADPRPVRRWRHDPARGPAPRPGGARLRPQPGRRADQQGADRDPAEVRRAAAGVPRARRRAGSAAGRARPGWPTTSAPTASGCATRRSGASATSTRKATLDGRHARRPSSPGSGRGPSPARTPRAASRCRSSRSWWLGKKKGKEAWVRPIIVADSATRAASASSSRSGMERTGAPTADDDGTVGRNGATCIACGSAVPLEYVRAEGRAGRMGAAADGRRRRGRPAARLPGTDAEHDRGRRVDAPGRRAGWRASRRGPRLLDVQTYGLTRCADLFTNRQLLALTTFSDLVIEARERVLGDALAAGMPAGDRLEAGGADAEAYADAVATYLGLRCQRTLTTSTSICDLGSAAKMEQYAEPVRSTGDSDGLGLR